MTATILLLQQSMFMLLVLLLLLLPSLTSISATLTAHTVCRCLSTPQDSTLVVLAHTVPRPHHVRAVVFPLNT
jgi:hypothetical protein